MKKLKLTGILIQDQKEGGYTSFIAEIPGVVAEGDTERETRANLLDALITMFDVMREEGESKIPSEVQTKRVSFDLAIS